MNIRSFNSGYAAINSQKFANQTGETNNIGGLFIGGKGEAVVANRTNGFLCDGGESNLYVINQGDNAKIKLGTGAAGYQTYEVNGATMATKNILLSTGHGCTVDGSGDTDVIFSYGQNCNIGLNGGADFVFANGAGTKVNGSDSSEYISGVPAGLPSIAYLKTITPYEFTQKIKNAAANIVYKCIS